MSIDCLPWERVDKENLRICRLTLIVLRLKHRFLEDINSIFTGEFSGLDEPQAAGGH